MISRNTAADVLREGIQARLASPHAPTVIFGVHLAAHLAARYPVAGRCTERSADGQDSQFEPDRNWCAPASVIWPRGSLAWVAEIVASLRARAARRSEPASFWLGVIPALRILATALPQCLVDVAHLFQGT